MHLFYYESMKYETDFILLAFHLVVSLVTDTQHLHFLTSIQYFASWVNNSFKNDLLSAVLHECLMYL